MRRRSLLQAGVLVLALPACGSVSDGPDPLPTPTRSPSTSTGTVPEQHDIVIVGAGIAGLTCAHYLKDADYVILEKAPVAGGRTQTGTRAGLSYAKGTEYLGEPEGHLADLISALDLTKTEIPSPMDAAYDGTTFHYGDEGIARHLIAESSASDYRSFVRLLLREYDRYDEIPDLNYSAHAQELDQLTAAEWLSRNGVPEAIQSKYNVASRGLFGASLSDISALSFIPEAAFDYDESDLTDPVDLTPLSPDEAYSQASAEESGSFTFAHGITDLIGALESSIGERLLCGHGVTSITRTDSGYSITAERPDGSSARFDAAKVVLAVPAPLALQIAPAAITTDQAALLKQVTYSSYVTVALFSKSPIFDKAFDLAVPDGYFFTDVYDATWVQRQVEPETPITEHIISVYIAPPRGADHTLDTMTDEDILASVYADLDKIFPDASASIVGHDITRFAHAYPIMSPGAYGRLLKFDELNRGSLLFAGDHVAYPTFEAALDSGYRAAKRLS